MTRYQWLSFSVVFIPSLVLFNTVGWTMILLFMQVKSASIPGSKASPIIPTVANFFPQIQSDLSRVKWGHGINSKIQLSRSLQGMLLLINYPIQHTVLLFYTFNTAAYRTVGISYWNRYLLHYLSYISDSIVFS